MRSHRYTTPRCWLLTLVALVGAAAASPALAQSQTGPTFTVNTLAGDNDGVCETAPGDCSLLEALAAANANADASTVQFSVSGTISPTSTPTITTPVTIDGTLNGRSAGDIMIDGPNGGSLFGADAALRVSGSDASGSVVRGLGLVSAGIGLRIEGAPNVGVYGNFVGTDAAGSDLGNSNFGIVVRSSPGAVLGGSQPGDGNVIGNSGREGVYVRSPGQATIQGNHVGTDPSGRDIRNNFAGVILEAGGNVVGGSATGDGNTFGFNSDGLFVSSNDNVVRGNFIGTDAAGRDVGNRGVGVYIFFRERNAILGNSIANNGGLGIDLSAGFPADGVTENDGCGDADGGPNGRQNFPVLASVASAAGQTTVAYDLDTAAGDYRVEFFSVQAPDPSGNGEGRTFLGSETVTVSGTPGSCAETFQAVLSAPVADGEFVTATATPVVGTGFGGTSEFSDAVAVTVALEPSPVACSPEAPLSFDADGSGGQVTADDFASVSGSFMGATGEFVGVRHENILIEELAPAIDLSTCSFVTFDPFTEQIIHSAVTTGTVEPDDVYVLATSGGDQALPSDVLFDDPGAFALVTGTATVGDDVSTVFGRVVAAVVYDRSGDVFASVEGGLPEAEAAAQNAAFTAAFASVFDGRATSAEDAGGVDLAVTAWPNPSQGRATVAFGLAQGGPVRVSVYDALGREVAVLAEGALAAGRHEASVGASLPAGVYVVRVAAEGGVRTTRLTVAR